MEGLWESFWVFCVILFLFILLSMVIGMKGINNFKKFIHDKSPSALGIKAGIKYFTLAGLILIIGLTTFCSSVEGAELKDKWFQYGEIYLGMDVTNKQSPQCHDGINSSRMTSNGGVIFNIWQRGDNRAEVNTYYLHHSCAFNPDRYSYDALGLQLTWRFFSR